MTDGSAWQVLRDLRAWQITQIPRRPPARHDSVAGQDQADRGTAQRLRALVSAFHHGAPVAFGWIREQPGGPVRILAAGPALARRDEPGQPDRDARPSLEDGLMSAWSGPFAWLVVAEPVANGQLGRRPYGLPRMPLAPGPPAARRAGM